MRKTVISLINSLRKKVKVESDILSENQKILQKDIVENRNSILRLVEDVRRVKNKLGVEVQNWISEDKEYDNADKQNMIIKQLISLLSSDDVEIVLGEQVKFDENKTSTNLGMLPEGVILQVPKDVTFLKLENGKAYITEDIRVISNLSKSVIVNKLLGVD